MLRKLLSCVMGPPSGAAPPVSSAPPPSATVGAAHAPAGSKPPLSQQLNPDTGVLVTGCQATETSADACPSGDPAQAFGALTNALTTCVKQHKASGSTAPLSYMALVTSVRASLHTAKFTQNPCLECSQKNASTPFIC